MVAFAVLVAAVLVGLSEANFKCCRDLSKANNTHTILDLKPILGLESLCMQTCSHEQCSSDDIASGLLGKTIGGVAGTLSDLISGPAQCLLNPNGDGLNPNKLSNNQACIIPCILDLNLLDTCDVQAILTRLLKTCPSADVKGLCASACLCCGKSDEPIDVCVNLCLTNKGVGLNIDPLQIGGSNGQASGTAVGGVQLPNLPVDGGLLGGATGGAGGLGGATGALGGATGALGGATGALGGATGALGGATGALGGLPLGGK